MFIGIGSVECGVEGLDEITAQRISGFSTILVKTRIES